MVLFSIIMVAQNAEKTIRASIDSVLQNKYENFELLVIDDGSADLTKRYVEDFQDKRIKYIYANNNSTGTSRNLGISEAQGEYLLFLDSDDLFANNILAKINQIIENEKSDYIIFDAMSFNSEDGEKISRIRASNSIIEMGTMVWNKAIKMEIAKNVSFPEHTLFEDVAYSAECSLRAKNTYVIHDVLYYYRVRANSVVHSKHSPERHEEILLGFNELINDTYKLNITESKKLNEVVQLINIVIIDHIRVVILENSGSANTTVSTLLNYLTKVREEYSSISISLPIRYRCWRFMAKHHLYKLAIVIFRLKHILITD